MTSIKPPKGPGATPDVSTPDAATESKGVDKGQRGAGFDAVLQDAQRVKGAAAETASQADAVSAIVAELKAGRIDRDTAIDRIVEHAMALGGADSLQEAGKAELAQLLRSTVENDPNLSALMDDI